MAAAAAASGKEDFARGSDGLNRGFTRVCNSFGLKCGARRAKLMIYSSGSKFSENYTPEIINHHTNALRTCWTKQYLLNNRYVFGGGGDLPLRSYPPQKKNGQLSIDKRFRSWTNITSHVWGGTGKKKKTRVKRRIRNGSLFTSCADTLFVQNGRRTPGAFRRSVRQDAGNACCARTSVTVDEKTCVTYTVSGGIFFFVMLGYIVCYIVCVLKFLRLTGYRGRPEIAGTEYADRSRATRAKTGL